MILNQITLPCTEETFRSCLEFYQALGLVLIVHTHDAYARFECPVDETGAPPSTLSLHVVDGPLPPSEARAVIYLETEDPRADVERLGALGIAIGDAVEQRWLWTEAPLTDPAGNPIKIYQAGENRRFPPWRRPPRIGRQ